MISQFFMSYIIGSVWVVFVPPINRFISDVEPSKEYSADTTWMDGLYKTGYKFSWEFFFIAGLLSALGIGSAFAFITLNIRVNIIILILIFMLSFVTAKYIHISRSRAKYEKKIRDKKYYRRHNLWLYIDVVFGTLPFLAILIRPGLQKKLIFNYVMAINSFQVYAKYIGIFSGQDREVIQKRMIALLPAYKNYFKLFSKHMGTNSEIAEMLIDSIQRSNSFDIEFIPKVHNYLSKTVEEFLLMNQQYVGKCVEEHSLVGYEAFDGKFGKNKEKILIKILQESFKEIFGVQILQFTKRTSKVKLFVDYFLIDGNPAIMNQQDGHYIVLPKLLWHIKVQNDSATLYESQFMTEMPSNIKGKDLYEKIAMSHIVDLSKALLLGFGIKILQPSEIADTSVSLNNESSETLFDIILDQVNERGENFLQTFSEEFYEANSELITAVFMSSSVLLALKHKDYVDLASGLAEGSFDLADIEWEL